MSDFWRTGSTTPIAVEGGLRARTERGRIGSSWWSQRFLAVLESFALGTRLTRGRAYARKGQVISLEIAPGVVSSSVQGSRPTPYAASVRLPVISEPVWRRIESALRDEAVHAARLLAGEMPADLEDVVAAAGARLFPTAIGDLTMGCSCPDYGNPCKHLAATFYLLAESFDEDPFRILLWRGRSRAELLGALGLGQEEPAGVPGTAGAAGHGPRRSHAGTAAALADLPDGGASGADEAAALSRFWLPPVPLPPPPKTLAVGADLLLRQLPDPPSSLGGAALREQLRQAYQAMATG